MGFIPRMQGWFNKCQAVHMTNYISRMKDKNYMIKKLYDPLSKCRKAFDKNLTPRCDINSEKFGIEVIYQNIMKVIDDKPTANIIFNDKELKDFPLKPETRKLCPLSPARFNIVLEMTLEQ